MDEIENICNKNGTVSNIHSHRVASLSISPFQFTFSIFLKNLNFSILLSQAVQYKSKTDIGVRTFEEQSHGYFHKRAKYTSTMSVRHADRQTDFTQRVIYFTVASYLASLLAKKIHIFYVVYLSVACDCKCAHEHMWKSFCIINLIWKNLWCEMKCFPRVLYTVHAIEARTFWKMFS